MTLKIRILKKLKAVVKIKEEKIKVAQKDIDTMLIDAYNKEGTLCKAQMEALAAQITRLNHKFDRCKEKASLIQAKRNVNI